MAMMSLTACVTEPSETTVAVCPTIRTYSSAAQAKVADELAALPSDDGLRTMITDYEALRDQVRACRKASGQ